MPTVFILLKCRAYCNCGNGDSGQCRRSHKNKFRQRQPKCLDNIHESAVGKRQCWTEPAVHSPSAAKSEYAVTWTISPSVGTINASGLYTAPAILGGQRTVVVTATSVADSTKSTSVTATLVSPVSVSPVSATLFPAQTQQFTGTITGLGNNTAVTWSISPSVGSVSSTGLFTAPASITSVQTVIITAISAADTTKSGTATVTLNPPVTVTVTPASATLLSAQTQQFTSTVTGSTNTALTWTISPAGTGAISATGLYTAPALISAAQTVTLTATSSADVTKSASAVVSLVAGTASPTISTLSPVAGIVGTVITITGSNFGASQGTSTVTFNGVSAGTASSWSTNGITVVAPQTVTTGNVVVTVNGTASNAVLFTVLANISFLTPNTGTAGTSVNILGSNFGTTQGTSTVTFNGINAGTVISWANNSITLSAPATVSTGNVVVTVNGLPSGGKPFAVPSNLISVSPANGAAGVQVTIVGSGFGTVQGTGSVWLGSTRATVVSWSTTQVVATVAANASSGTARVQQGGVWSNSLPFTVATAAIATVTPASGLPGTQVTIAGSNFGASQGTGQVWLGTAYGVVQSWNNTQITAQVAVGSASGVAQVLQNGVWSSTVSFTVNGITLTGISPATGVAGTSVTFSGSGFGAVQGMGTVWLGSKAGQVVSWSDTAVVATVAPGAVTGIARIQQGTWSKAFGFTVPGGGGSVTMLTPNLLNMQVGDTGSLQALNSSGQPVTGATWLSSDPAVVSLSADNPPVLTALAAGRVTITAGGASADVTVYSGPLPVGTVFWSNPTAASYIVPAVPSSSGVADIFAIEGTSSIKAITKDGFVAWTANLSDNLDFCGTTADFQGGLLVHCLNNVYKLDGLTGQPYPAYTNSLPLNDLLVHVDGTIFNAPLAFPGTDTVVVGINPVTGAQKFSIPLTGSGTSQSTTNLLGGRLIAGDGYAYFPYTTQNSCGFNCIVTHVKLLRVDSVGAYSIISIRDSVGDSNPYMNIGMITNADTGVLVTMKGPDGFYNATISGTNVVVVSSQSLPGQSFGPVYPLLQAQDGSFVGEAADDQNNVYMVSFEANGNIRWSVPNETPDSATDDGGFIGRSGITYSQNGSAVGQTTTLSSNYGWLGNLLGTTYSSGANLIVSTSAQKRIYAPTFAAMVGGNASSYGTSILQSMVNFVRGRDGLPQLPIQNERVCYSPITIAVPTCGNVSAIELQTTLTPDFIFQNYIQKFAPVARPSPNPIMDFTNTNSPLSPINVTGTGQKLTINLKGVNSILQGAFDVMTTRFDPVARTISVVTLGGHPLAGWRYFRVYPLGQNVVIETGAYDQPASGSVIQPGSALANYIGYYVGARDLMAGWKWYLLDLQLLITGAQGPFAGEASTIVNGLGNPLIPFRQDPPQGRPRNGYWDYWGDFTSYICKNINLTTSCY